MKLTDPVIIVPWFDSEGMKQRTHLCFKGLVDVRRVQRELRRWAKLNFKTVMSTKWAKAIIKANKVAFTQVMQPAVVIADKKTQLNQRIEDWIKRIQDDTEDEGEPDTNSEGSIPESPEVLMPVVSTGPES